MYCGPKFLTLLSFSLGAIAVVTLALSVATDAWLFTVEPTTKTYDNETFTFPVYVRSGLWRVCTIIETGENYCHGDLDQNGTLVSGANYRKTDDKDVLVEPLDFNPCLTMNDFDSNPDRVENQGTSFAILRSNRIAAIFPVISLVLLTFAAILSVLGNLRQDIKTLISAVIYILAGLSLAVGIILYISVINDEVGHRSKEKDKDSIAFNYTYGWSFYFAGNAFLCAMLTAVILVSLYLQRNSRKEEMVRIIPGLDEVFDVDSGAGGGASNPTVII